MTTRPTGLIRCRLSNVLDAACEFTAHDGRSLAVGASRAFARYVSIHGDTRYGAPVRLELQVAPTHEPRAHGWFAPCRVISGGRGVTYVHVFVSADLLSRRSPDDWSEIWSWVEASRRHEQALSAFATQVARE